MKISHFTALFLLGMLTAACSGDKNADSSDAVEQNKPEASVTESSESKPEAAAPKAGEGKPEAAAPKGGESKPEAAASKGGESKPEASVSKPYISEYDEFFINVNADV